MTVTGHWTPVALSASIDPATSSGTHVDGKELVVWRDNSGIAHVWEDRCPHRGMRLSFGFVRGDHIACLYHGWQFDTGGQCQYIPAHPNLDVPKTIKVPRYKTVEVAGMIWTSLDDSDAPALPSLPDNTVPVRSLYVDATLDQVLALIGATAKLSRIADGLARADLDGDVILIGLQALSSTRVGLHFAIETSADGAQSEAQIRVFDWIAALRFAIEHPGKPTHAASLAPVREAI